MGQGQRGVVLGVPAVGTNALETMVSGRINGAKLAAVDASRMTSPR